MDDLSRLLLDNIHLLGQGKVSLNTEEETREVLERIHQDGHLGIRKTLRVFRRRFAGVRDRMICQAVVSSCLGCQLGSDHRHAECASGTDRVYISLGYLKYRCRGTFCEQ